MYFYELQNLHIEMKQKIDNDKNALLPTWYCQ